MTIKVTVTQKELHDFLNYGRKLREDPCIGCPDKSYCRGCIKQSEWVQELESLPVTSDVWDKYENVRNYIESLIDLTDVKKEINKLLKKQADLRDKTVELLAKFEVVDE